MASFTNSIFDIGGAFAITEKDEFLGPDRVWNAINEFHQEFLPLLEAIRPFVHQLQAEGLLEARISWLAKDINEWFKERGFTIELKQTGPNTFYAGSIYEQLVHWLHAGLKRSLQAKNGTLYPDAVFMENGVEFFTSPVHQNHVTARLATKSEKDTVYMTVLRNPPTTPFGLLTLARDIQMSLFANHDHDGLVFPMVDLDVETDIAWLKGLWTTQKSSGDIARVSEAKQQSILKMDETGALAKSAMGMAVTLEMCVMPRPALFINEPFLFWIAREDYPLPLFSAWVDYDTWKNPGGLE
jgi:hypothetical protein